MLYCFLKDRLQQIKDQAIERILELISCEPDEIIELRSEVYIPQDEDDYPILGFIHDSRGGYCLTQIVDDNYCEVAIATLPLQILVEVLRQVEEGEICVEKKYEDEEEEEEEDEEEDMRPYKNAFGL